MSEVGSGPLGRAARRSFGQRLVGAFRLDATAYDDVATDPAALGQAALVVAAAACANAIGVGAASATGMVILAGARVVVLWPLSSLLLWAIANWFGHPVGLPALLRVVGFAMAPLAVLVLLLAPVQWLQMTISLLATALFFAALVVGVREALRVETGRAAFVCLVAGLAIFFLGLVFIYVATLLGGGA